MESGSKKRPSNSVCLINGGEPRSKNRTDGFQARMVRVSSPPVIFPVLLLAPAASQYQIVTIYLFYIFCNLF